MTTSSASEDLSTGGSASLRAVVRAMELPVLVADYRPVIHRHRGKTAQEVVAALDDNDELIASVAAIEVVGESRGWSRLYGSDGPNEVPGLAERLERPSEFPRLKAGMIEQLSAPWRGVTSIILEHTVPTSWRTQVVVTSNWGVAMVDGEPDWSRVIIVDLDVTDLRSAEYNLAQANRLEAIGAMAAGIAHELNTPLQFINDNLSFISASIPALEKVLSHARRLADTGVDANLSAAAADADLEFVLEELPFAIRQSVDGVAAMANIVLALKAFSHPGSGEKEPVDLNAVIEHAVTMSRNQWKNVAEIHVALDPDLPEVQGYGQELLQVLLNLIVNAVQAIAENHDGGTLGRIDVSTSVAAGRAIIEVRDDGGGVPESIRGRVFDPFFTTKEVGKGTGQGLAMARRTIVEGHGGLLNLDVEEDVGSIFTIRLPIPD